MIPYSRSRKIVVILFFLKLISTEVITVVLYTSLAVLQSINIIFFSRS